MVKYCIKRDGLPGPLPFTCMVCAMAAAVCLVPQQDLLRSCNCHASNPDYHATCRLGQNTEGHILITLLVKESHADRLAAVRESTLDQRAQQISVSYEMKSL